MLRRVNQNDYGNDGTIDTFNEQGEPENLYIYFQLKSTDHIKYLKSKKSFTFDLSKQDLEFWLYNTNPVIIVLFDAQKEVAYFMDIQDYFRKNRLALRNVRQYIRVYFPENAIFDTKIILELRKLLK